MTDALITHDTPRIIAANDRACLLFRCDPHDLIDADMVDLVYGEDMRGLVRLRLRVMREHEEMPPQMLPLLRPDGSRFWAEVKTDQLDDGSYQSALSYKWEY